MLGRFYAKKAIVFYTVPNLLKQKLVKMSSDSKVIGTTAKGLTKDFSFPVPWGSITGKIWGADDRPPILCIHGWLDNCNTFDKVIPLLPKDFKYVAVDLPGHGLSSHISHGMWYFSIQYCIVIKRVMENFKWDKMKIMGHSMGANVATYFAGLYPDMVDCIVVIDTAGIYFVPEDKVVATLRSSIDSYLKFETTEVYTNKQYTYKQAKERLLAVNKSLTDEAADILLERGLKDEGNGMFTYTRDIRHQYRNPTERNFSVALAILKEIRADILFVWAKQGLATSMVAQYQKEFAEFDKEMEINCKIQTVMVEGDHHVHLCNPEETAEHVSKFLLKED